ncbi:MarR family transcriptional regulator [Halomonas sp. HP20-15]|uniref:MarR family winged helix-turn-helix transcriptional regulator n=1 Tax=Halomonas sp. HP20-15 TaxID=3085901 RepID=UPI0029824175|nr:MarR family transcriptional regulator [Halomonas sp. HP20-15]MDW5378680.1 MarR family transcriptional regulator [Halomonas sp. HP20-15]
MAERHDHVDTVLDQWQRAAPQRDASPMATFTRLYRLFKYVDRAVAAVFREHGLHEGEFDLLATLYRSGEPQGLTPNALRAAAVLTSGAMTHRLDRLESAGYIRRVPNPEDRRSVRVRLTAAGAALLEALLDDYLACLQRLQAPLDAAQRRALGGLLRELLLPLEANDDV